MILLGFLIGVLVGLFAGRNLETMDAWFWRLRYRISKRRRTKVGPRRDTWVSYKCDHIDRGI